METIVKITITLVIIFSYFNAHTQCVQCDTNSNPSGNYASVGGMSSIASGQASLAVGLSTNAVGNYSIALGKFVTSNGASSVAIGRYLQTITSPAMIIGCGYNETNYLQNGISNSLMIGFNSNLSTLFIQKAQGVGYTGKVGIGNVTDPQAKLHIKADNNETASVLIEPSSSSGSAYLWLGTSSYGLKYSPTRLEFLTGDKFVFYTGNIGIGTYQPTEKLEIAGNIKQQNGYCIETERIVSPSERGLTLFNYNNQGIFISDRGRIGINTTSPATALDVNGRIKATSLQIPGVAPDDSSRSITGYVLRSLDINGNAGWTAQSNLDDGDWTKNSNDIYRLNGKVGIGVSSPVAQLELADFGYEGTINLKIGDEAYLSDIDEPHTLGVLSYTSPVIGAIKLGLDGPVLFGNDNGFLGIGTNSPCSSLDVKGTTTLDYNQGNMAGSALIVKSEEDQLKILDSGTGYYGIFGNQAENTYIKAYADNGTEGAAIFMNKNGNVGIGTNTPSKALDVTGDIKFSGDLYKNDQLLDLNTWGKNGSNIYYNQGNVGIGITSPAANLHIVSDIGDTDAEFLKIQNTGTGVLGSGKTIIGKQVGGGPVIIQQAGNSSFINQGSTLSFIQKSANNQVGLNISTFTFTNGSVKESNICAPDCALTVGAKENLNLRSQNGDIKFYANAPLIDDALLAMTINNAGQVGIGTETHIDNFTRLTVAGRIHAQEVKVTANAGADFVFGKDYDLPGIAETADFIKVNQHLPGIPSAAEMQ